MNMWGLWECVDCGRELFPEELIPFHAETNELWEVEYENEPTCPYCGSLNVVEVIGRGDDDDNDDD